MKKKLAFEEVIAGVKTLSRDQRLQVAEFISKLERHEAFVQECDEAVADYRRGNVGTRGLEETLYLMSHPINAARVLEGIRQIKAGQTMNKRLA